MPERTVDTTVSRKPEAQNGDALGAYRAMWRDLARASQTSDPASPLLDDHATGGALALMRYGLRKSRKEGLVSKGSPKADPHVVRASANKVVLEDCVDDSGWLLYKANGELKDDVPGGHVRTEATVRRVEGAWKVTDLYAHETGSC
ncbi:hypothetical protein [Streptomyces sp. NPDC002078]